MALQAHSSKLETAEAVESLRVNSVKIALCQHQGFAVSDQDRQRQGERKRLCDEMDGVRSAKYMSLAGFHGLNLWSIEASSNLCGSIELPISTEYESTYVVPQIAAK